MPRRRRRDHRRRQSGTWHETRGRTKVIEDRPHDWINGKKKRQSRKQGETSRGSDVYFFFLFFLFFLFAFLLSAIYSLDQSAHSACVRIFSFFLFTFRSFSLYFSHFFSFFFLYFPRFVPIPFYSSFLPLPRVALARSGYTCLVRSAEISNAVRTRCFFTVVCYPVCVQY